LRERDQLRWIEHGEGRREPHVAAILSAAAQTLTITVGDGGRFGSWTTRRTPARGRVQSRHGDPSRADALTIDESNADCEGHTDADTNVDTDGHANAEAHAEASALTLGPRAIVRCD
jgi:hypothetical protein